MHYNLFLTLFILMLRLSQFWIRALSSWLPCPFGTSSLVCELYLIFWDNQIFQAQALPQGALVRFSGER